MILAAFIILKISRSYLAGRVDLGSGEKAYFAAIVSLREFSLQNDDLYARGAMILTQLWTSSRVFRRPDGVIDALTLRIRTRLSMSVVFDCFWWWREEFQGKTSPYNDAGTQQGRGNGSWLLAGTDIEAETGSPLEEPPMCRQASDSRTSDILFSGTGRQVFAPMTEPFPDYDWAGSFEFSAPGNLTF